MYLRSVYEYRRGPLDPSSAKAVNTVVEWHRFEQSVKPTVDVFTIGVRVYRRDRQNVSSSASERTASKRKWPGLLLQARYWIRNGKHVRSRTITSNLSQVSFGVARVGQPSCHDLQGGMEVAATKCSGICMGPKESATIIISRLALCIGAMLWVRGSRFNVRCAIVGF